MSKVILITGASSGFGKATAEELVSQGYKVYGTSRNPKQSSPTSYSMLKLDVKDQVSIANAVSEIIQKEGKIDVLINNAGIVSYTPLEVTPIEELEDMMDTNFKGPLRLCQAVLPGMRERKEGLIINVSSIAGLVGLPFMGPYCASKFALEGLMESLSMEVKPFGINVCLVEPGDYNTEIIQNQTVADLLPDSPYRKAMHQLAKVSDDNTKNAPGPQAVANKIRQIVQTDKPRLRYRVGNIFEKSAVFIKFILPSRFCENLFFSIYGLEK